jgi:hypothetical protein
MGNVNPRLSQMPRDITKEELVSRVVETLMADSQRQRETPTEIRASLDRIENTLAEVKRDINSVGSQVFGLFLLFITYVCGVIAIYTQSR